MTHNIPYQFEVHTEIGVNEAVTHTRHGTPPHLRMLGAKVLGDLLGRFANNLQAAYESPALRVIR